MVATAFLASAVDFGCAAAKSRKGDTVEVADIATYVERTW